MQKTEHKKKLEMFSTRSNINIATKMHLLIHKALNIYIYKEIMM